MQVNWVLLTRKKLLFTLVVLELPISSKLPLQTIWKLVTEDIDKKTRNYQLETSYDVGFFLFWSTPCKLFESKIVGDQG